MRLARAVWFRFLILTITVVGLIAWYVVANSGGERTLPDGGASGLKTLTVAAPPGGLVGLPVVKMARDKALEDAGYVIEMRDWKNPEQLRAMIAAGEVDFIGMPSHLAANFHNRGVNLRLMNVSIWSVLWVVSADESIHTLDDLKGRELVVPFKGNLPDVIIQTILGQLDFKGEEAIRLRYASTPLEAAQLLLSGRARYALLSEPECSLALLRSREMEDAAPLARRIDIQEAWGQALDVAPRIPLAGMVALGSAAQDPQLLALFHAAYAEAVEYCRDHPAEAGELAEVQWPEYFAATIVSALSTTEYHATPSAEVRGEIAHFLEILGRDNPARIGEKMPGDAFYWPADAE